MKIKLPKYIFQKFKLTLQCILRPKLYQFSVHKMNFQNSPLISKQQLAFLKHFMSCHNGACLGKPGFSTNDSGFKYDRGMC